MTGAGFRPAPALHLMGCPIWAELPRGCPIPPNWPAPSRNRIAKLRCVSGIGIQHITKGPQGDLKCDSPVLPLIRYLQRTGWYATIKKTGAHRSATLGLCDCTSVWSRRHCPESKSSIKEVCFGQEKQRCPQQPGEPAQPQQSAPFGQPEPAEQSQQRRLLAGAGLSQTAR